MTSTDEKLSLIKKYLKRKKEQSIVELIIKDYNETNFYISLLFNSNIEKFKVLYIPLDVMDTKDVENYTCYQFIQIPLVNYILETIDTTKEKYEDLSVRDKLNKNISSYYIEINTHVRGIDFSFKTTQYLPKEWSFMYEVIMILFEHIPNIMNELGVELLAVLNNSTSKIEYNSSLVFDLFNDNIDNLFEASSVIDGKKYYAENKVTFLEKVNSKYFAIVNDYIVIVDYNENKKILNLYCDNSSNDYEGQLYAVLKSIINNKIKPFYKITVAKSADNFWNNTGSFQFYLCYGLKKNNLKVIHASEEKLLPLSMFHKGLIKICYDKENILKKEVLKQLEQIYSKKEVERISKNIVGELPK